MLFVVKVRCQCFLRKLLLLLVILCGVEAMVMERSYGDSLNALPRESGLCKEDAEFTSSMESLFHLLQEQKEYLYQKGILLSRIFSTFFQKVAPSTYENRVRCLYTFYKKDPETVSDLLFFLQKDWENHYLGQQPLKGQREGQVLRLAVLNGASLGALLMLMRKPWLVPVYLNRFRWSYPLGGAVLGGASYALGKEIYQGTQKVKVLKGEEEGKERGKKEGKEEGNGGDEEVQPLSPAHLLDLPSLNRKEAEYDLELKKQWQETLSIVLGIEAGSLSYYMVQGSQMVQWGNKILTPFKVNLVVFVGAILVGVGVEELSGWAVSKFKKRDLERNYAEVRQSLLMAHQNPQNHSNKEDLGEQIFLAQAFVEATHALCVFYQLDFLQQYREVISGTPSAGDFEWNEHQKGILMKGITFLEEAEQVLRSVAGESYLIFYANLLGSELNRQRILLGLLDSLTALDTERDTELGMELDTELSTEKVQQEVTL